MFQQTLKPIPENIIGIIKSIQSQNHVAYLVGGCVRDLLVGITPKDFDIATDAKPQQLLQIFSNRASIIGRRFPIVQLFCGKHRLELTTFRGTPKSSSPYMKQAKNGQILIDNHYGTEYEDAFRRDLTINALYYDPVEKHIIDYVSGIPDIQNRCINVIGDISQRFREDPLRMLRSIRLANKLDFTMSQDVFSAIRANSQLINTIAPARLFEELLKITLYGQAEKNIHLMSELGLMKHIFPLSKIMRSTQSSDPQALALINISLKNTDERILNQMTITPSFLFAALLWSEISCRHEHKKSINRHDIMLQGKRAIAALNNTVRIPKRFSSRIVNFWQMQYDLQWPLRTNALTTLRKKDFRAAFDFLIIREQASEIKGKNPHIFWQNLQDCSNQSEQLAMIELLPKRKSRTTITTLSSSFFGM